MQQKADIIRADWLRMTLTISMFPIGLRGFVVVVVFLFSFFFFFASLNGSNKMYPTLIFRLGMLSLQCKYLLV